MPGGCREGACASATVLDDGPWRRALWVALAANASMFALEVGAGVSADSQALKADALDFFGDAANYAISLAVAGLAIPIRSRAALLKGVALIVFAIAVVANAAWAAVNGAAPLAATMGAVGALALAVNFGVALMLYRFRGGDANRRSAWICSRNDAIGNVAVLAAAAGVFGTGTAWPDLIVAGLLASLGAWGGSQIVRHAWDELHVERLSARARGFGVSSTSMPPNRGSLPTARN